MINWKNSLFYKISSDIRTTLSKLYDGLITISNEINSLNFDNKRSEIPNTIFKLEALLLDYDRIVILDADLLILKNIDELFELKTTISAVLHSLYNKLSKLKEFSFKAKLPIESIF